MIDRLRVLPFEISLCYGLRWTLVIHANLRALDEESVDFFLWRVMKMTGRYQQLGLFSLRDVHCCLMTEECLSYFWFIVSISRSWVDFNLPWKQMAKSCSSVASHWSIWWRVMVNTCYEIGLCFANLSPLVLNRAFYCLLLIRTKYHYIWRWYLLLVIVVLVHSYVRLGLKLVWSWRTLCNGPSISRGMACWAYLWRQSGISFGNVGVYADNLYGSSAWCDIDDGR